MGFLHTLLGLDPTPTLSVTEKLAIVVLSALFHHGVYLGSAKLFAKFFQRFNFTYADQRSWRSKYV